MNWGIVFIMSCIGYIMGYVLSSRRFWNSEPKPKRHKHTWGMWQQTDGAITMLCRSRPAIVQVRSCTECGFSEIDSMTGR